MEREIDNKATQVEGEVYWEVEPKRYSIDFTSQ